MSTFSKIFYGCESNERVFAETLDNVRNKKRYASRLISRDPTLWNGNPEEIRRCLGWLDVKNDIKAIRVSVDQILHKIRNLGIEQIALIGMGGSSLGPGMLSRVFHNSDGYLELVILDSTVPASVISSKNNLDLTKTLFIVASKSGTTAEVLSLYNYFRKIVGDTLGETHAGSRFIAITDRGSPLAQIAIDEKFLDIVEARPDIGGRYSLLSHFGMIPAGLIGLDIERLCGLVGYVEFGVPENHAISLGLNLGAFISSFAKCGRNKLSIILEEPYVDFGLWIEQLVAESTGKNGKGVIPIIGEPHINESIFHNDRLFVLIGNNKFWLENYAKTLNEFGHPVFVRKISDPYQLGVLCLEWEIAVAIACAELGVNPFDQPGVQATKDSTERILSDLCGSVISQLAESDLTLKKLLSTSRRGNYISIMAFLPETSTLNDQIQKLRLKIATNYGLSTTFGYGPRFLHSTGQIHKNGPDDGLFLQITQRHKNDIDIPRRNYSFGALAKAQATANAETLVSSGRHLVSLEFQTDPEEGLRDLIKSL